MAVTATPRLHLLRFFSSSSPSPLSPLSRSHPPLLRRCHSSSLSNLPKAANASYTPPDPKHYSIADWVSNNDSLVRALPIFVGGLSLLAVLLNRALSGIAPVADASSSQSRADILALSLAVTNLLAGLVWLSIRPKSITPVVPIGVECSRIKSGLSHRAVAELLWAWDSFSATTCCRSLVIVYRGDCLLQIGVAAESPAERGNAVPVEVNKLIQGSLYMGITESGKQSYLANLSLYPGRTELPFLPANTQSVILQPLSERGIMIIGGDTVRGFTNLDQAWITLVADKLDATLSQALELR